MSLSVNFVTKLRQQTGTCHRIALFLYSDATVKVSAALNGTCRVRPGNVRSRGEAAALNLEHGV